MQYDGEQSSLKILRCIFPAVKINFDNQSVLIIFSHSKILIL